MDSYDPFCLQDNHGPTQSHMVLKFVTELVPSEVNTVVLTVIDRFSKDAHFVSLPKFLSAFKTAQIMIQLHEIPNDVSDHGPQFISQVWRTFCEALGASISLSTGITLNLTVILRGVTIV